MEQQIKQSKESREEERIVRIISKDIPGKMNIYAGLSKIKGISWAFSNAICQSMKLDKKRKIGSLTDEEIKKITEFIKKPKVPGFLHNRQFDYETGENKHLTGSDLELRTDFDIKRLKKIKSYRGIRHAAGLTLRGQRTRSHFRSGTSVGVQRKTAAAAKPAEKGKKGK